MVKATQVTSGLPSGSGNDFLVNPKSASMELICKDSNGSVLGSSELDMLEFDNLVEYLVLAYGILPLDCVKRTLLALERHAMSLNTGGVSVAERCGSTGTRG